MPEDLIKLIGQLPNIVENYQVCLCSNLLDCANSATLLYQVPWNGWNDFDFLYAIDVDQYQNEHLLEVLQKYPIM